MVDDREAAELRAAMVAELIRGGHLRSPDVIAAFEVVPREQFAPGVSPREAYAEDIVVIKKDARGTTVSSVSAPRIQAMMLELAGLRPGMHVLEVGSGGPNAALIAEIVGPGGVVTTVDIDRDVVARARACLADSDYSRINAVLADAEQGVPEFAPYHHIVVTVEASDIPPAWVHQLADDGAITMPLRIRNLTRAVTFTRRGDHLVADGGEVCGFVPMRGVGANDERLLVLRGKGIGLRFDEWFPQHPELLADIVDTPRQEVWTGVRIGRAESFDTLQLWLASSMDGYCRLAVDPEHSSGLVRPVTPKAADAAVEDGNLAYLTARPVGEGVFEFGVHAFGADAAALAARMAQLIQVWDSLHRNGPGPQIFAYPAGTGDRALPPGRVIDKRHVRIVLSWRRDAGDTEIQHHAEAGE